MLSDADLERIEASHKSNMSCQDALTLLAEVRRLRAPLTGEDARLIQRAGECIYRANAGTATPFHPMVYVSDVAPLLDLLSRYEHAVHDRELDAGAFMVMRTAEIVAWLRDKAKNWRRYATLEANRGNGLSADRWLAEVHVAERLATDLEAQGVADPAPPAVVRAELARVRAKVLEVLVMNIPTNIAAMLHEVLEGEKTP